MAGHRQTKSCKHKPGSTRQSPRLFADPMMQSQASQGKNRSRNACKLPCGRNTHLFLSALLEDGQTLPVHARTLPICALHSSMKEPSTFSCLHTNKPMQRGVPIKARTKDSHFLPKPTPTAFCAPCYLSDAWSAQEAEPQARESLGQAGQSTVRGQTNKTSRLRSTSCSHEVLGLLGHGTRGISAPQGCFVGPRRGGGLHLKAG